MNQLDSLRMIMAQALEQPIGLLLQVSDFALARQRFYRARAEAGSDMFNGLQFRASPLPGGNLIIVNRKVEVQALPAPEISQ